MFKRILVRPEKEFSNYLNKNELQVESLSGDLHCLLKKDFTNQLDHSERWISDIIIRHEPKYFFRVFFFLIEQKQFEKEEITQNYS